MDFVTLSIVLCFYCFNTEYNITIDEFKDNYLLYLGKCKEVLPKPNEPVALADPKAQMKALMPPIGGVDLRDQSLKSCIETNIKTQNNELLFMKKNIHRLFNSNASKSSSDNKQASAKTSNGSIEKPSSAKFVENVQTPWKNNTSEQTSISKQNYSFWVTTFLVALYSITIVVSFIGNVLVIIVMCCGFRSSYLDISAYLSNLGIFNLLMATFCLPFTFVNVLVGKWIFSSFMCPLTNFFQMLSVNGCILTLTTLAVNRFLAVTIPLKFNSETNKTYIRKSLVFIWGVSLALASVQLFIYKCVCFDDPNGANVQKVSTESQSSYALDNSTRSDKENKVASNQICYCKEIWDSTDQKNSSKYYLGYTIWIFFQTYFIPVIILVITSSKIIDVLRKRNRDHEYYQTSKTNSSEQFRIKTIKSIRMLIVVMGTFALNWLPIHIFQLYISFANYNNVVLSNKVWITVAFFACHWLSMSNSFVNPIIYSFMNLTFRSDLGHLIYCNKTAKRPQTVLYNHEQNLNARIALKQRSSREALVQMSRQNQDLNAHMKLLKKINDINHDMDNSLEGENQTI